MAARKDTTVFYPELKGKTALVTGAGKSIGRDIVRELVQQECNIIAVSRTLSDLEQIVEEYSRPDGPKIIIKQLDVSDRCEVENWFETLPPIHYLINNAAVMQMNNYVDVTEEMLDQVMSINFKAPFHLGQLCARSMISNHIKGVIINVSSVASNKALSGASTLCCSKAALNMLTQVMSVELGNHGIRAVSLDVTAVMTQTAKAIPGFEGMAKPFTDRHSQKGRICEEDEISRVIPFLLSDNSSIITGSAVKLDLGYFA